MITMLYCLWQARNDARESKVIADPRTITLRVCAAVQDWKNVQKPRRDTAAKPTEHCLSPDDGWVKVNADGAFRTADAT